MITLFVSNVGKVGTRLTMEGEASPLGVGISIFVAMVSHNTYGNNILEPKNCTTKFKSLTSPIIFKGKIEGLVGNTWEKPKYVDVMLVRSPKNRKKNSTESALSVPLAFLETNLIKNCSLHFTK